MTGKSNQPTTKLVTYVSHHQAAWVREQARKLYGDTPTPYPGYLPRLPVARYLRDLIAKAMSEEEAER